ncbi:MAG: ADP-glyceromanno-heptose 6-epimerase [Bacteroidales bacterium]|jgi:ADP-L-glycero-D-manno-heptose 6-epimerase|nr:ADP-glyceromanno-heptose 6-epimerase [Bacteroidales bacterium]
MKYIIVTGAAGFIGSCLLTRLYEAGYKHILAVDDFSKPAKSPNFENKKYIEKVSRTEFFSWLEMNYSHVGFVLHIGARTDTTETNWELLAELNLNYTQQVWDACTSYCIPLIYASSAATYGLGEYGYDDDHDIVEKLKPLNLYGKSKNEFDKWALEQEDTPPFWAGLKFFNVYGPNEYHKNRMASVILHAFEQIAKDGKITLFRSHHPDYQDGCQKRDFVYVKDVVDVILFLMEQQPTSGLYNVGTGTARTFLDLAHAVFAALNKPTVIEWTDTPEDIRDKYQYFTQANMEKLLDEGYSKPFTSLEEGIKDYITNYLLEKKIL